jgi:hypothetical protein
MKSKGPVTAEGKKIASRNSMKHALACSSKTPMLLPGEDGNQLSAIIRCFEQMAGKGNEAIAARLVEEVWRVNRALNLENGRMGGAEGSERIAEAWDELSCQPISASVNRYLTTARNRFRRAAWQMLGKG